MQQINDFSMKISNSLINKSNSFLEASHPTTQSGQRAGLFKTLFKTIFIGLLLLGKNVMAAKDLCQKSNMNGFCQGNLGITRENMPQLEGQVRDAYLLDKLQQGAVIHREQIPAHLLVPVQSEINHDIVINMVKSYKKNTFNPCERQILVAHNGTHYKIMDGHHTCMACRLLGKKQEAIVIFEKNNEVLAELQQFPGSFRRQLDDSISSPKNTEEANKPLKST